jgi:hypothetical protein
MSAHAICALLTLVVVVASQVVLRGYAVEGGMLFMRVPDPPAFEPIALGVCLAGLAIAWCASWRFSRGCGSDLALRAAPLASVGYSIVDRRRVLLAAPDWLLVVLAFGALLSAASLVPASRGEARSTGPAVAVAGAIVAGIALRVFDFAVISIDPRRADMLPLVLSAIDQLLHGRSPYGTYHMPWAVPLTYLPLTWLAFVPAFLARVDPRWTSTVCELALLGILGRIARRARAEVLLLGGAWFAASSLVTSDALTAMPVQSLALGASVALVAARSRVAPIALGLALATTTLAIPLLGLVVLYWWPDGRAATVRRVAVAFGIAAALVVPWVAWAPREFWAGTVAWFGDLDGFPRQTWEATRAWAHIAGFTGVFWSMGWQRLLRPVQATLVLAVLAAYARKASRANPAAFVSAAAATAIAFALVNVIIWSYLYEPACVLALAAVAVSKLGDPDVGPATLPSPEMPLTATPSP